ncbi:MAG: PilZ domain-containing protein [Cyanobium sp.]
MLDLFQPAAQAQPPKPEARQQRQSKRYSVPVVDVPIRVDLLVSGMRHPCHLWDVSRHGACLLLRTPVQPGQRVLLQIHAPGGDACVAIEAQARWLDAVMGSYYAGMQFAQPIDFGPTFLGALMLNAETLRRTPQLAA